jgi:hypothetical protein
VQTQIGELPASRIINLEGDTRCDQNDALSPRSPRLIPIITIDSPPITTNTRKRSADSESRREESLDIKQEPIDVEALSNRPSELLPLATIKHDSSHGSARKAKRVKLEEAEKNDHVDMSQIEEFKWQEPIGIKEKEILAEQQLIEHEQTVETEVGHVAEDELSEEERRMLAEEKAKNDEELEEVARQWAERMKKAAEAEQSVI